jgi:hypothetical protein
MALARTIDALVDRLSLEGLVRSYPNRGSTPHRPDLMLQAILLFTQRGIHRPAPWRRQCCDSRVVSWLLRGIRPSRARWYAFRDRLVPFLDHLNKQLLHEAQRLGLLEVVVPVLDGTLFAANSSRHKLFNHDCRQSRLEQNAKRRKEDRKPPDKVLISLGDPQASLGFDKDGVYRPICNVQLASDLRTDFCLAYEAFSGVNDSATLEPMLARLAYFLGGPIRRLLTDAGYATGANLLLLEGERIELIAPWQENDWTKGKKKSKQIPKSAFTWDEARQSTTCPEGHELKYVRKQTKHRGEVEEKHQKHQCPAERRRNCPRQKDCTTARGGRIVMSNEYEEEMQRHNGRMETQEAKELYKKRKEQIERRVADSKEHRNLLKLSKRGKAGPRCRWA